MAVSVSPLSFVQNVRAHADGVKKLVGLLHFQKLIQHVVLRARDGPTQPSGNQQTLMASFQSRSYFPLQTHSTSRNLMNEGSSLFVSQTTNGCLPKSVGGMPEWFVDETCLDLLRINAIQDLPVVFHQFQQRRGRVHVMPDLRLEKRNILGRVNLIFATAVTKLHRQTNVSTDDEEINPPTLPSRS